MAVRKNCLLSLLSLALVVLVGVSSANASPLPVTFAGSSGSLAASISFSVSGNTLIATLTNTSTADVTEPANVLTGVFFTLNGVTLTTTGASALLNTGSSVIYSTNCDVNPCNLTGGGNVGGEWEYLAGLNQYGANAGISSTGLNIFGGANFNGLNLQDPAALDGLQFGITSAGDNVGTGNTGVTKSALIKNSVVFTLPILTGTPNISNVTFQYGTALDEGTVTGNCTSGCVQTPEPSSLPLLGAGIGLLGLALVLKRDKVSIHR